MKCPDTRMMARLIDGELSVNQTAELKQHLATCDRCIRLHADLRQIVESLPAEPGEFDSPDLVREIVQRARAQREAPSEKRPPLGWLRFAVPAVAAMAAVAVALLLVRPGSLGPPPPGRRSTATGAFTARGTDAGDEHRFWAFWIYQRRPPGKGYEKVEQRMAADARVVFGYLNAPPRQRQAYRYLMILAVDDRGRVRWYYPAYDSARTDPESIAVQRGRHELRDEIQHDLTPGALRIFAIFSREPWRVHQVERALAEARTREARLSRLERIPLGDPSTNPSLQLSHLLRVE